MRLAAVECDRARRRARAFGGEIRALFVPTVDEDLRVAAAIASPAGSAIRRVGGRAALLATLDLKRQPRVALAEIAALVQHGHASEVAKLVADALPDPTALAALSIARRSRRRHGSLPEARRGDGFAAGGDARTLRGMQ